VPLLHQDVKFFFELNHKLSAQAAGHDPLSHTKAIRACDVGVGVVFAMAENRSGLLG
jgi:hypothetical protein